MKLCSHVAWPRSKEDSYAGIMKIGKGVRLYSQDKQTDRQTLAETSLHSESYLFNVLYLYWLGALTSPFVQNYTDLLH